MSATPHLNIIDGPNRDYLFDAVKYLCDEKVNMPVRFTIAPRRTVELTLTQIGHEDGSGHSLLFDGYMNGQLVNGWYHTRKRIGTICARH